MMETQETPHSLGYRMPAEWEPHSSTWIAWPHNAEDWPGKFQPIPWVYSEIVRNLSQVEDVNIIVNNADAEKRARGMLLRSGANLARLHFHHWRTDRIWLRDSGPIFVRNAQGGVALPTGSSTPGPSIRTGLTMTSCPGMWQTCRVCSRSSPL